MDTGSKMIKSHVHYRCHYWLTDLKEHRILYLKSWAYHACRDYLQIISELRHGYKKIFWIKCLLVRILWLIRKVCLDVFLYVVAVLVFHFFFLCFVFSSRNKLGSLGRGISTLRNASRRLPVSKYLGAVSWLVIKIVKSTRVALPVGS